MPVTARQFSSVLVGAVAMWPFLASSCEELAVLSDDGRYIVLSADNLEELDVGSLRWLNVRKVDGYLPNSTFSVSALTVKFVDPESGSILDPRTSDRVIFRELGRNLTGARDLTVLQARVVDDGSWIDNGRMDRIVTRDSAVAGAGTIVIMDGEGNEIARSNFPDAIVGRFGVGCEDETGRTIIGGLTSRMIVQGERISIETLDQVQSLGYRLGGASMGCITIAVRVDESAPDRLEMARIDLSTEALESEFTTPRWARRLLFDEGQRMIEHEMEVEPVEGGFACIPRLPYVSSAPMTAASWRRRRCPHLVRCPD